MNSVFNLIILPRKTMTRDEFLKDTPECSIALDGVVSGGPFFDPKTKHINFDHHDGVIREATMSTCMQVFMAIKGGIMEWFRPYRWIIKTIWNRLVLGNNGRDRLRKN